MMRKTLILRESFGSRLFLWVMWLRAVFFATKIASDTYNMHFLPALAMLFLGTADIFSLYMIYKDSTCLNKKYEGKGFTLVSLLMGVTAAFVCLYAIAFKIINGSGEVVLPAQLGDSVVMLTFSFSIVMIAYAALYASVNRTLKWAVMSDTITKKIPKSTHVFMLVVGIGGFLISSVVVLAFISSREYILAVQNAPHLALMLSFVLQGFVYKRARRASFVAKTKN